jgi:hypothetical protein
LQAKRRSAEEVARLEYAETLRLASRESRPLRLYGAAVPFVSETGKRSQQFSVAPPER